MERLIKRSDKKMKIQLPNPKDYLGKEDLFFEQLELCIFHAKKAWDKVKKRYPADDDSNYPWLAFHQEDEIEDAIRKHSSDVDYEKAQNIVLSIEEL